MTKECSLTLKIPDLGKELTVSGVFEDEEWELLADYSTYAQELAETKLVRDGIPGSLSITWTEGAPVRFETQLPHPDLLGALLHKLRPFMLTNEPTFFYRICNMLTRNVSDPCFRSMFQSLRDLYSGKDLRSRFTISALGPKDVILNSSEVLSDWLNAYEYHRDKDKRVFFEELRSVVPLEGAEAILLGLLTDRVRAILGLAQIARVVLGQKREVRVRGDISNLIANSDDC